jgi:hypothetical protein
VQVHRQFVVNVEVGAPVVGGLLVVAWLTVALGAGQRLLVGHAAEATRLVRWWGRRYGRPPSCLEQVDDEARLVRVVASNRRAAHNSVSASIGTGPAHDRNIQRGIAFEADRG